MTQTQPALYPMRFEPIHQYRPWGGRRLTALSAAPLPGDSPIGESWLLSDRDDHPSLIANGPLKGKTLADLFHAVPNLLLGRQAGRYPRFPLLLKFLDVQSTLSVQVHPSDLQTAFIPPGESGKTEGWVVLETTPDSRIYAGLTSAMTAVNLRCAIDDQTVADHLASFQPKRGDSVLIPAGTVHCLTDVVVFEVQENSDVTFRLYDWDHVDPATGQRRPLQIDQALACIDFARLAVGPTAPVIKETAPVLREQLIHCEYFAISRISAATGFTVGADATARVLVCTSGGGHVDYSGAEYAIAAGDILLLPAVVGALTFHPSGAVSLLEVSLPESDTGR